MTKLEQKLIELGYEQFEFNQYEYNKEIEKYNCSLAIIVIDDKIESFHMFRIISIKSQQDIDNLQLAYNELQKDLEALKEYEK